MLPPGIPLPPGWAERWVLLYRRAMTLPNMTVRKAALHSTGALGRMAREYWQVRGKEYV
jgi:hypothetical protein